MWFVFLQIMTGLECGHRFCTTCWCEYLTTKIMEEGLVSIFRLFSSIAHSNKTKCRRLVTIFCWIYWCFQWGIWFKKNISVLLKTLTCLFVIKQIFFFLNNDWKTLLTSSSKINQENHSLRIQMSISIFISLLKSKKKSMGPIVAPYYEIK